VTVAVLPEPTPTQVVLRDEDLEFSTCRGSGAGGQHRNKTESAVQLKHLPSGLMVRCENERSQSQNKESARQVLRARLWQLEQDRNSGARASDRKRQVGSGMRGDKRRTIRTQDDVVNDHETGKQWRYKDYARGNW
jgi:peptide chain release factor 1